MVLFKGNKKGKKETKAEEKIDRQFRLVDLRSLNLPHICKVFQ